MDRPMYRLSKLYIPTTIFLLFIYFVRHCYKFFKYLIEGRLDFLYGFNFPSLFVFLASVTLLILLLYKFKLKNKNVFLVLFFTISTSVIFSYDFSLPTFWADALGDIKVGRNYREQGFVSFLNNYHKPTLHKIKKDPQQYEKFMQYDSKLKLNYKRRFDNVEISDTEMLPRINKHPPSWFCIIGLWQTYFGDSYLSHKILAKVVAILYLVSFYFFLGLFFKKEEYKSKLLILSIILLLPTFLEQAIPPKNDLILGVFVTWVMYFLLKNKKNNINYNDLLVGLFYSMAILFKFTSLSLSLPIFLYYIISFKYKAIPKLFIVLLSFSVFPLLLYTVFEYDMILNILTGRVEQGVRNLSEPIKYNIKAALLGQYLIGIPFVLLLIMHIIKIRKYLSLNETVISYLFFTSFYMMYLILYGSDLPRHLVGYLPLTIPLLVHIFKNCEERRKMLLSTSLFLIVNSLIIFIYRYILINDPLLNVKYTVVQ